MSKPDAKKAKADAYLKGLEGRCYVQGHALVQIANLCRADGGDLAQRILGIAGEIIEPRGKP
jgi:hypothetical protein